MATMQFTASVDPSVRSVQELAQTHGKQLYEIRERLSGIFGAFAGPLPESKDLIAKQGFPAGVTGTMEENESVAGEILRLVDSIGKRVCG